MTFHIQQKPTSTTFKSKHKVREKKERKVIRSTKDSSFKRIRRNTRNLLLFY